MVDILTQTPAPKASRRTRRAQRRSPQSVRRTARGIWFV